MPLIEIKGLSSAVAGAKRGIADLRSAAAGLNTETSALNAEIVDLTEQVKQHRKDLRFEAETLGNSPPPEEKPKPPLGEQQVIIKDADMQKTAQSMEATAKPAVEFHG